MIAELYPEAYDIEGRPTFRPRDNRRRRFRSTFPIGRYLSHSLSLTCRSLEDLRAFLKTCRGVSDEKQFGKPDYWMPPEEFERSRKGDCDDFAMYAWRQLLEMGYKARFVVGTAGPWREGHAWVTFEKDSRHFLLEPQACHLGMHYPRLEALRYTPFISAEWDGEKAHFFFHKERKFIPPVLQSPWLALEWVLYRTAYFLLILYLYPAGFSKPLYRKLFKRKLRSG